MFRAMAVHCTQIFAQEDLWSQPAKEGRSLGCLCVCPGTSPPLRASQTCSWGMVCILTHCAGALWASLPSCQDAQQPLHSPQGFLCCPLDPPLHAPNTNTRGAHVARQTR